MTDPLDDDIGIPKVDIPIEVQQELIAEIMPPETVEQLPKNQVVKVSVGSVTEILPIAAQNVDEAARIASMFCVGGMVPKAYEVKARDGKIDWNAVKSRLAIAIIKGSQLGVDPISAVNGIYIVNGKPSIYGDLAKAVVQRSGYLEWEKTDYTGEVGKLDRKCTVTLKRRGQEEVYKREFTKKMAETAGLLGKKGGVWKIYDDRMLYWRAWTWAARDGFSDAMMGLSIMEEIESYGTPEPQVKDTSSLDDVPVNAIKHHQQKEAKDVQSN